MSDMISSNIYDIGVQLQQYAKDVEHSEIKITTDFLLRSAGFSNYFVEYFINGLLVLIQQDKIDIDDIIVNEQAKKILSNTPILTIDIVRLLMVKKQYHASLIICDAVLQKNHNLLDFLIQKGLALLEIRDYDKADTFCEDVLKIFPNDFMLNETYARNAHRKGDWKEALNRWVNVVRQFPMAHNPLVQLAFVLDKNEGSQRIKDISLLLLDSPNKTVVRIATAKIAEIDNDYAKAAKCYQGILVDDNLNQNAIKGLFNCYIKLGDKELINNHIDRSLQLNISNDIKTNMKQHRINL